MRHPRAGAGFPLCGLLNHLFCGLYCLLFCGLVPSRVSADILGEDFDRQEENREYRNLPVLRLSLGAGLSQWIYNPDSTTKAMDTYLEKLDRGENLSAQLLYYPWIKGGLGLEWIWFMSHAAAYQRPLYSSQPIDLKERVSFVYYGPVFQSRIKWGASGLLTAGFGAGYLDVLWTRHEDGKAYKLVSGNPALSTSIGYEWLWLKHLGLGGNGRFLFSNMAKYTVNGKKITLDDPRFSWYNVPLYRLEFDLGLRFYL